MGMVTASVTPSHTQVQCTPRSVGWPFASCSPVAPGAGLMFAREAEVALRTALIGISASALIMGCFPGTKLPCLKNVWLQSKHASALGQSLPGVCSGSADLVHCLHPWCRERLARATVREGGPFPCQAINLILVK